MAKNTFVPADEFQPVDYDTSYLDSVDGNVIDIEPTTSTQGVQPVTTTALARKAQVQGLYINQLERRNTALGRTVPTVVEPYLASMTAPIKLTATYTYTPEERARAMAIKTTQVTIALGIFTAAAMIVLSGWSLLFWLIFVSIEWVAVNWFAVVAD